MTYDYTAGSNLSFNLNNVVSSNQLIIKVDLFTSLFNNNRYQFLSNGDWDGNWKLHFFHIDNNISVSLDSSFNAYSFTLYFILDFV